MMSVASLHLGGASVGYFDLASDKLHVCRISRPSIVESITSKFN